jgi:ATP-dependent DNA ligase
VFDGEIMSSSFQDLMKQLYRKEDVKTNDSILYLFDCIPLEDFKEGYYDLEQIDRRKFLTHLNIETNNIKVLDYEVVDLSTLDGKLELSDINNKAIEGKYEGIMIKSIYAPYECKRTKHWLKLKPFITVDLTVVGIEEGEGKYENSLGALVCEGEYEGKSIEVNVGSGFSDDLRSKIFQNINDHLNKTVEIKCDAVTQSDGKYSLRFPVFMRFRYDK